VIRRRLSAAVCAAGIAVLALAGCSETPSFSSDGTNTGYVSGGGAYTEITPAHRKPPVSFSGTLDTGAKITSAQLLGKVHVLNFWYAGCGPCRVEAPRLESVYKHYKGAVPFVGVNTYDQASTALTFESTHHVTYPSVIDVNTVSVQYAFSKYVPTNSVPTTLVIDKHGRVAARVTGEVEDASILTAIVDRVIAEGQ
jgi:thiol-disulfide isomerase/thioredoxin